MHFDPRHPYERFMARLSQPAVAGAYSTIHHSRFTIHRLRMWLYGLTVIVVLTMLIWNGQRSHGIATASADRINQTTDAFALARAEALKTSNLTPAVLLKKAAPLIDGGNRALAIELLTEANRRDPTIRDVNLQLGYAYLKDA